MVQFYLSRDLAEALDIKLSKWKRWSRAFLAPDPLGGKQSGYARQFSIQDAFKVYLGGYMVGQLNMGLPQAKKVMDELEQWFSDRGFFAFPNSAGRHDGVESPLNANYRLDIYLQSKTATPFYRVLRLDDRSPSDRKDARMSMPPVETAWIDTASSGAQGGGCPEDLLGCRCVYISRMLRHFHHCLAAA